MSWYEVKNVDKIDSPALLVYPDRIQHNIDCMIANVGGNPKRLSPHVKTHKMAEVIKMQLEKGIERFKCATISEMEMTLAAGAKNVVIAYQMTGPKVERLLKLVQKFPNAILSSLVDDIDCAKQLAKTFSAVNLIANVYLDVDNGMHRTGFPLNEDTFGFIKKLTTLKGLNFKGLHIYDGQFRVNDFDQRKKESDLAFRPVYGLVDRIKTELNLEPEIINGGSPSFSPAALRSNVYCSPGTVLLWDAGYAKMVPELDIKWAAILMTRVISKPTEGIICLDLGHKAVGSENPIDKRIHFLNLENYEPKGHSEEHLIIKVKDWDSINVGDVFYGVPYHVCPSVALHEEAHVIEEQEWTKNWEVVARKRKITV